jgi:uncharacterized protein DUF3175
MTDPLAGFSAIVRRFLGEIKPNRRVILEAIEAMAAPQTKRWSQRITETSDALDLEQGVFTRHDPKAIARSLKRSAERSHRRKADPYRSAMSMLTFYINRAGKTLSKTERARLEAAKDELRELFGRPRSSRS